MARGLETPMDDSNKGFLLLAKMGYRGGHGLGKTEVRPRRCFQRTGAPAVCCVRVVQRCVHCVLWPSCAVGSGGAGAHRWPPRPDRPGGRDA